MNPLFWDRLINIFKWPIAVLTLLTLPAAILGFGNCVVGAFDESMTFFWVGFGCYVALWYSIFCKRIWGSWLSTLEHEFTHAIFAWLTFHRVTDFHTSWSKGGHIKYVGGEGNWLITISPYFFPLASLLFLTTYLVYPHLFQGYFHLVMGVVIGFQACSSWREVHRNQPDLKTVGWPFVFCFLPTSNLLVYSWFLGVLQGRTTSDIWGQFYVDVTAHFKYAYQQILVL